MKRWHIHLTAEEYLKILAYKNSWNRPFYCVKSGDNESLVHFRGGYSGAPGIKTLAQLKKYRMVALTEQGGYCTF